MILLLGLPVLRLSGLGFRFALRRHDHLADFEAGEDFGVILGNAPAFDRAVFGFAIGEFDFDGPAFGVIS